jgi:methylmalonyl-CoA mutase N-terminal domain/subunit
MAANDDLQKIKLSQKEWEDNILKKYLEDFPEREILARLPVQRLYTLVDRADSDYLKDIGFPGEYPFTRGITPTMYRSKIWDMADYAGYGTPEQTQKLYKYLLEHGMAHISIAFDLPTQLGYDADDPEVEGEVAIIGTSLSSLRDAESILDGIPLDKVGIRGSISSLAIIAWAMYIAAAEKKGFPSYNMLGNVCIDCLSEFISRGVYIFPPEHSLRLSLDLVEYALKHIPKLTYLINSYVIGEQGATAVQEGGYALSANLFYLEEARKRGISVEDFSAHLSQHTAGYHQIFEEVAKCRAMRRLWAKLAKDRFTPKNPKALQCLIEPNTGGSLLTAQQAENNIVRLALAVLGLVLGGVNYVASASFDEAHGIPTRKAATLALRTQQIIAYESGAADVVDPLGGSYYVEALTDQCEKEMLNFINQIESRGGLLKVTESGWIREEIRRSAYVSQKELEEGKRIRVGLNKFCVEEEPTFNIHKPDPKAVDERRKSLKKLKEERDGSAVQRSLKEIDKAAHSKVNLMPFIIDAVKNYATLGEITRVLKSVFGEYKPTGF